MVNLGCSDNTVHMNSLVNNLCPVHELSGGLPPQVPVRSISTYFMSEEGLEPEVTQGGNKCSWESLLSPFLYFSLCLSRPNIRLNFHSRDNNNYFILLLIGHSCIPRSTPTSQLVHRLCWGKQSRVASTGVRPFDIFEFEDTGSSLLGNKTICTNIWSTTTLNNGWSGTIIPDLPSSVRLSLYPLRLKWVIPELTLWTTLFTWSLLKSHHDTFSCSKLHREKQKNKTHTALVTDRGFLQWDVNGWNGQRSWPGAGLQHVRQNWSREAGAATQVELQQVWVPGQSAEAEITTFKYHPTGSVTKRPHTQTLQQL